MTLRIRRVMKGTKSSLFLAEYGHGDLGVMDKLVHGAAIDGDAEGLLMPSGRLRLLLP